MNKQEATAARKEFEDFVKSFGFKHRDVSRIRRSVCINDRELLGKALAYAAKGERIDDEQLDELHYLHGIFSGDISDECTPIYDDEGNLVREASPEWFELKERCDVLDALYYAGQIIDAIEVEEASK